MRKAIARAQRRIRAAAGVLRALLCSWIVAGLLATIASSVAFAPPAEAARKKRGSKSDSELIETPDPSTVFRRETKPARFALGGQSTHFKYEEPGQMKEFGTLYGLRATGEIDTDDEHGTWRAEFDYLAGELTYDGAFQDGTPVISDTDERIWYLRGTYGMNSEAQYGNNMLFAGLGYRSLVDVINGIGGYRREKTFIFLPVGYAFNGQSGVVTYGAGLEFDLLLYGLTKSFLSQAVPTLPDIKNRNPAFTGYGARVHASIGVNLGAIGFSIQPYLQYWDVGESDFYLADPNTGNGYFEPKNNSYMYGVNGLLTF